MTRWFRDRQPILNDVQQLLDFEPTTPTRLGFCFANSVTVDVDDSISNETGIYEWVGFTESEAIRDRIFPTEKYADFGGLKLAITLLVSVISNPRSSFPSPDQFAEQTSLRTCCWKLSQLPTTEGVERRYFQVIPRRLAPGAELSVDELRNLECVKAEREPGQSAQFIVDILSDTGFHLTP